MTRCHLSCLLSIAAHKDHVVGACPFVCVCVPVLLSHLVDPHRYVLQVAQKFLGILPFWFLCPLRSIAAHWDHFVRRLSVRPSVCVCVCPVVTLSWLSRIAMFRRRHMHSSECCYCFLVGYM